MIVKKRKQMVEKVFTNCPVCNKEILGQSESELAHNLKIHSMTHEKEVQDNAP